jgi:hypothetical protein
VAILTPGLARHTFFEQGWQRFAGFVAQGFWHIAGGADHLLFLLTVLLAATGWRYGLAATLAFTLAHSLTLALSAFDVVRLPSAVIEPGIAASIVGCAALALWRGVGLQPLRLGVVFACGLLHGLGFAAGLGALLRPGADRLALLAGFNIGIELGQLVFIGLALLAMGLMRAVCGPGVLPRLRRGLAWLALGGGGMLLLARLAAA